jgi:3-phosphoshikimate 1-carboxyvinyltransferase
MAALAPGASEVAGALTSLDARSTAAVLRRLGVSVSPLRAGSLVRVVGRPQFRPFDGSLHCGNSGTTARLLLGILASQSITATVTGDRSLRQRPMARITDPLSQMGARIRPPGGDRLPITIAGGSLRALRHIMPVSSAQVKGCLLFAGLAGGVPVALREPNGLSRDHTERLLRAFGYRVATEDGWIAFEPTGRLEPFRAEVPGDASSAAFLVGYALLASGGPLRISSVGLNPTRTHYLEVLRRMGAAITVEADEAMHGEPVGDIIASPGMLRGVVVAREEIPSLIDEIPMLAVLASQAEGTTVFHDVGELRVKESDRLGLLAHNLGILGADAQVVGDDLVVQGSDRPLRGLVRTEGDHRLAMAFSVLGAARGGQVEVDDLACSAVSFPGFPQLLARLARSSR